jgi:putative CocE/NonD family hydrolase
VTVPIRTISAAPVDAAATEYMVRMRDGIRLATDVYLPGGRAGDDSPGAAILVRLPYDKASSWCGLPTIADYMTRRGYRVVVQDVRGKFRSEGVPMMSVNESADGYDTIDWIVQQPWSNGRVAMWGDSYYGFTQWAAAGAGHPALRAIAPRVTGRELAWLPVDHPDGVTREIEWSEHRMYLATTFTDQNRYEWPMDWSTRPYEASVEQFFSTLGHRSPSWDQWHPGHPVLLRRFPEGDPLDAPAIQTLITVGWWDICAPWGWQDWFATQARGAWGLTSFLLVDSMDHEGYHLMSGTKSEDPTGDEWVELLPGMVDPGLDFFDVFLRDLGSAASIPKIRWNLAHTEGFRAETAWPPEGLRDELLHATADGRLAAEPDPEATTLEWIHDPDALVPNPVPREAILAFLRLYPDEGHIAERSDVLVFRADAVGDDSDLVGRVSLSGHFDSTGPVMDVFARLLDVDLDGGVHLITRGQVNIPEVADGRDISIDLGQVGYRLQAGHALMLYVASSSFPEFMPQPGTGDDPWTAVEGVANRQSTRVGGSAGLRLQLQVLPAESA